MVDLQQLLTQASQGILRSQISLAMKGVLGPGLDVFLYSAWLGIDAGVPVSQI